MDNLTAAEVEQQRRSEVMVDAQRHSPYGRPEAPENGSRPAPTAKGEAIETGR